MDKILLQAEKLQQICQIAKDAGKKILEIYQKDFEIYEKKDESPLTEADLASHHHIVAQLEALTPDIPILSEESSAISWQERSSWETYWLIDPLDGTKEFIKKNGEFTVNIALIYKHNPVLGVVYAPVLDTLYFGSTDIGAKKQVANASAVKIQSAAPINPLNKIKIVGSRSHASDDMQTYLQQFSDFEMIPMGSSLKLCLVAEGAADIYPRLGPTSEWDTAAAHAVVVAAGGRCINYETNEELLYNTKESLLNPYFIVQG
ncbi:MAG: 3'(2'),5'-bisphosphate nucleotidase CysQ [Kangiellaceae bacterium]|nr:3'(2'),5'-bisphosphate nucleotidase CysQ [Kangiellaceae bacterium]